MQRKRFSKKKILGILKSYHAKQRQKERNVTDQQLIKILQNGELDKRSEYETIITFEGYHVYLSLDLEKIITITSPDIAEDSPKLISSNEAQKIKTTIEEKVDNDKKLADDEEMTFEEYMKNKFK
jgi:hypothetical protein